MTLITFGNETISAEHVLRIYIDAGHGNTPGRGTATVIAELDGGIKVNLHKVWFSNTGFIGERQFAADTETLEAASELAEEVRQVIVDAINEALQ